MDGALHRKLVEEFTDIATIIDSDGTITYVSPSVTRTLGYEPEELIEEDGYEYQHPDDCDAVADAIESLQTNPDSTQIIQTRFRHADGSWCWIEATLQNRLDDPDINGILVNSRDISQRKQQEQQLRSQKEQLNEFASVVSHDYVISRRSRTTRSQPSRIRYFRCTSARSLTNTTGGLPTRSDRPGW